MAQIKIDNLSVTGSDLFSDSESYLDELSSNSELQNINGGTSVGLPITWMTVPIVVL